MSDPVDPDDLYNPPADPRTMAPGQEPLSAARPAFAPAPPPGPWVSPEVEFKNRLHQLTRYLIAVPLLILANVAVFGIMLASGVDPMEPTIASLLKWGAGFGPLTTGGEWWRLFTLTFLHIGIIHIVMNMFVLADVGRIVERIHGTPTFFAIYALSGWAASLTSVLVKPDVVSAGASGAVFGVCGALLAFLVRQRASVPTQALHRLRGSIGVFIVYNVLYGLGSKTTDNAAHFGGLIAGFLLGLALDHELTRESRARTLRRVPLVVIAGLVALGGATYAIQGRTGNYAQELASFAKVEQQVIDKYNAAFTKANADPSAEEQQRFVEAMEKDVLPPWREAEKRLQKMTGVPSRMNETVNNLRRYVALRREAWELLVLTVRQDDEETGKRARAKADEAEAVLQQMKLNALKDKP